MRSDGEKKKNARKAEILFGLYRSASDLKRHAPLGLMFNFFASSLLRSPTPLERFGINNAAEFESSTLLGLLKLWNTDGFEAAKYTKCVCVRSFSSLPSLSLDVFLCFLVILMTDLAQCT